MQAAEQQSTKRAVPHSHPGSVFRPESRNKEGCQDQHQYRHQHRHKRQPHDFPPPPRPRYRSQPQPQPQPQLQHDGHHQVPKLTFYPTYCYKASPTWFAWVKLTAQDVHQRLHERHEYQVSSNAHNNDNGLGVNEKNQTSGGGGIPNHPARPTSLLFYLNHPIRFIQLVGIVVTFEDYLNKFWLFTVDDSSGSTIEVTCSKPEINEKSKAISNQNSNPASRSSKSVTVNARETVRHDYHDNKNKNGNNERRTKREGKRKEDEDDGDGDCDGDGDDNDNDDDEDQRARLAVMGVLTVGTAVQVKGTISTYRHTRQLHLERIKIIPDTNHEMALVSARNDFYAHTLSKPWHIPPTRVKELREEEIGETRRARDQVRKRKERTKMMAEREQRHAERLIRQYERDEEKRKAAAEEARAAGQLLKRPRRE